MEFNGTQHTPQYNIAHMNCMEAVEVIVYSKTDGSDLGINWEEVCLSYGNASGNFSTWEFELNAIYFQKYPPAPELYVKIRNFLSDYVLFSVCLFGLVANLLVLVLLLREKKKSATVYFLLALAVTDQLVLLARIIIPGRFISGNTKHMQASGEITVIVLTTTSEIIEVWMIVAMTVERFIVVCFPLKARTLCTVRNARYMICAVFFGSIIYRIPAYLRYADIITDYSSFDAIYDVGLDGFFIFLLPMGVLSILNIKLMKAVYQAKRRRQDMTQVRASGSKQEKQNQTSVAMTCNITAVVVLFLVCQSLRFVFFLWIIDYRYWRLTLFSAASVTPVRFVVQPIANIMFALNSALNCCIYFLFYPRFREKFRATFCPCFNRTTNNALSSKTTE